MIKNLLLILVAFFFTQKIQAQQFQITDVQTDSFPIVQLQLQADDPITGLIVIEDGHKINEKAKLIAKENGIWLSYKSNLNEDGEKHQIELKTNNLGTISTNFYTPEPFYSLFDFLKLLGSLGLFLFGMKFMSEGIQKTAGERLRDILGLMTTNKYLGVFTGFLVTAIIQSSSATTVMIVSFTNAGLFSLTQSIGVIMGANIGTTVTGWIISILGLKVSLATYSLPILGIAFPFLFFANEKTRNWAEFFIGFALLFMGLHELKMSVPDIKSNPEVLAFLEGWSKMGFFSLIIFIFIGALLTVIVQSSSASMALTLVLLNNGWIDFQTAAALVLGENIGTTITAQLAALIANIDAKRAAMAHTLFNLTGILWVILIFSPFLHLVNWIVGVFTDTMCSVNPHSSSICGTEFNIFTEDKGRLADIGPIGLSAFHTTFNITNTFILIWFVKYIEQIVKRIIPSKGEGEEVSTLRYINQGMMATPELALIEARKEIKEYGHLTFKMFRYVEMLLFRNPEKYKKILKRISSFEEECDREELEIAQFLAKVSMQNLSANASKHIRSMWTMISELERIGDLANRLSEVVERKIKQKYEFTESTEQSIKELFDLVEESFDFMLRNLSKENGNIVPFEEVLEIERKINEKRNELRNNEFILIENGQSPFQSGLLTIEIVSNLEKIADHIFNVNQAAAGIK